MIRKITLLFLLCVGVQSVVLAQGTAPIELQMKAAALDPASLNAEATNWVNWYRNHNPEALLVNNSGNKVFTIPVVIHVIIPGPLVAYPPGNIYDPTDATLTSMIDYLNQTFRAVWSSYADTNSGGTYIPIQFVLAQRTGTCGVTSGIERIDGSGVANYAASGVANGSTTGASEVLVKNLSRWPINEYYNIWIVNKIDGKDGTAPGVFTAGYSYNPTAIGGGAPANKDGMILLATQAAAGKTIVPQQMGFAFGLLYTYWGSTATTCPPNVNCLTDGDQVCDTEPEKSSAGNCPTATTLNSCTGSNYAGVQHNFMDNSSCQNRFTPGQRARMIWGLYTYRQGLIGSLGGIPTGLSPAGSCSPAITNAGNTQDAGVYDVKIEDNFSSTNIGNVPYVYLDFPSGGYNTDGNVDYIDRTCREEAVLTAGTAYKFFVKAGPTTTGEEVRVYIDYNNDGAYAASELVYSHNGTVANELDSFVLTLPTSTTMPSLVTCIPIRMRVISDTSSSFINPCGPLNIGQAEDYDIVIKGSGITGSVTAVLPPFTDSSCVEDTLVFSAQPSPGAGGPITYKWYVNGTTTGVTSDTFLTNTIADGSTVTVKMYYTNQCGSGDSALSNTIVIHRFDTLLPVCMVALTVGNNPSCPGSPVTFTATPVHGGSNPGFQWQINGVNVSGATADTFTSSTLNSFDTVSCILYSSAPCAVPATVLSNPVVIYHYVLTAGLSIAQVPTGIICSGRDVAFIATPTNSGANPTFQWYIQPYGGSYSPVFGATSFAFVTSFWFTQSLLNVMCIMNAPDGCVINHLDTSNQLTVTVDSTYTPYIHDSIALGHNPWCLDSIIVFGASDSNYGTLPAITWLVNGVPSTTGLSTGNYTDTLSTLQEGDVVTLQVNQTDGGCYTHDTLLSTPITMVLVKTPDPPIVSLIGTLLESNVNGNSFKWYYTTVNAFSYTDSLISGATSQTYPPFTLGYYYCRVIDTGCQSPISNIIKISLLDVNTIGPNNVKLYPNPTSGHVMVDWGKVNARVTLSVYNSAGQEMLHDEVNNQSQKMVDMSNFANGNYFIEVKDVDGNVGTFKVSLSR